MNPDTIISAVWAIGFVALIVLVGFVRRARKRGGPAAAGAIWEWHDRDKQRALEVIVEEKAEERRPEYPDGSLPDLESPKPKELGG